MSIQGKKASLMTLHLWATLNKEHRVSVFEKTILKKIFGLKRDENVQWRKFTMKNYMVFTINLL